MKLHKEGIQILITTTILVILTSSLLLYFIYPIGIVLSPILIIFLGFVFWFFRNPNRKANNPSPKEVIAPVDGKVVIIKEIFEKEYLNKQCLQLSIFMSPLNVHVCRYPVTGTVVYTKYHPGKYLVAWHEKSSELNERTTVVVNTINDQPVLFRQIAGFIARRIVLYAKPQDIAQAGEEYGFIKFGSRLDIFLPLGTDIKVKTGDIISKGGEQVIAILP